MVDIDTAKLATYLFISKRLFSQLEVNFNPPPTHTPVSSLPVAADQGFTAAGRARNCNQERPPGLGCPLPFPQSISSFRVLLNSLVSAQL